MKSERAILSAIVAILPTVGAKFPRTCPAPIPKSANSTLGVCPTDFTIIGSELEPVHESIKAPTGLAIDPSLGLYLTYPRNSGPTPDNVVKCTSFDTEEPWPSAAIQNCTTGQNASTCFINVQNIVLDSVNQLWVVDSGIPPGEKSAFEYGAKIMSFSLAGELLRTYIIPSELYYDNMNANDVRINNTLGEGGYAFITDESDAGSILSINLATAAANRRLFNTTYTRADEGHVGVYNGQLIYSWNGTRKSFITTGSDGIALASGNVYWGVLASRRFYYISQAAIVDNSISDEDLLAYVQDPGQCGTEQAGLTADDKGRVYICASEHNAIFYMDTLQAAVNATVNGVPPGSLNALELVPAKDYVVKTLVMNALIQHADSAAIWDGWLYFCTNQLELSPGRQYNNVDARRGPFRSYRVWIGAGPAI
ncbi:major royal jelly protein [Paraphaeosphaeria minitans]|uniref:Major royal jelly protein n=1 Tax=Paraphaeosphaeria minitans TaxID=565426 RepID=A0A9P6GUK4_9PLEO|nr:major royal jelly protein [Paraphaeosphaeria minitans]